MQDAKMVFNQTDADGNPLKDAHGNLVTVGFSIHDAAGADAEKPDAFKFTILGGDNKPITDFTISAQDAGYLVSICNAVIQTAS